MEVLLLPPRHGKTSRLLEWMQSGPENEWRVGVFHSLQEAHNQMRAAYERGEIPDTYETWQFIALDDVLYSDGSLLSGVHLRGGRIVFGIDNLDLMLSRLFGRWPIGMVTMTEDPS